jgi:hypothetical protein
MQAQPQNTSICQTCVYQSECVHCRNCRIMGKPVLFCENFDNRKLLQVSENEGIYSEERSSQFSKPGIELIPGRMKGLCMNCDNRRACRLPIREGGVWHCEEYC